MSESFDEKIEKLTALLEKNEILQAEKALSQLERTFHFEMMNNLKRQREQLFALHGLNEARAIWMESEWNENDGDEPSCI